MAAAAIPFAVARVRPFTCVFVLDGRRSMLLEFVVTLVILLVLFVLLLALLLAVAVSVSVLRRCLEPLRERLSASLLLRERRRGGRSCRGGCCLPMLVMDRLLLHSRWIIAHGTLKQLVH